MTRDTAINVLLIIAGIVLAIALFGAGALWKPGTGRSSVPSSLPRERFVIWRSNEKPQARSVRQAPATISVRPARQPITPECGYLSG